MELALALALPRDTLSIPVCRRVLSESMRSLGVREACIDDITVALAEACTNVLDHAAADAHYDVSCRLSDRACVIEVIDRAGRFDGSGHGLQQAPGDSERGRGIQIMRSVVDSVRFEPGDRRGSVVHLEKLLEWRPDSPVARLAEDGPGPLRPAR